MISSMTGFARQESHTKEGVITLELRAINQRYLETYFRLPENLRALEPAFREVLTKKLSRGKIEISLRFSKNSITNETISFNQDIAKQLILIHQEASLLLNNDRKLSATELMRFPNVLSTHETEIESLKPAILSAFNSTVDMLIENRQTEGARIKQMISSRLDTMSILVADAKIQRPDAAHKLRERLLAKIKDLNLEFDAGRLEQEIVIQGLRIDIDEEIDRLHSHITEMHTVLNRNEPVGRRLDFLTQELNREANTLGSKSQDSILTKIAVDLKVLIEQIREQIQNIE